MYLYDEFKQCETVNIDKIRKSGLHRLSNRDFFSSIFGIRIQLLPNKSCLHLAKIKLQIGNKYNHKMH